MRTIAPTIRNAMLIGRATKVAARYNKPLIATSDAHRLHAFGRHFTSMPRPAELTCEHVFANLRTGPLRLTSPSCTMKDLLSAIYFIFLSHPARLRRHRCTPLQPRQVASSAAGRP
jgi:hypothetical protein